MRFDAIVVGGGVVGLSAAWRLLESGMQRVMLLENRLIASGATGLGTGSVHTQRWHPTDTHLILRSKALMSELSQRSGGSFNFYSVGRLTVVGPEDVATVATYGDYLRQAGVEAIELAPDRLTNKFPGMNVQDVGVGLYTKDDGTVYPAALIWAIAGIFRSSGGHIWEGCGVARIAHDNGVVHGVVLKNGDLLASDHVIVAAGIWSRQILQNSELGLALKHAITHNTVVTVGRTEMWEQVPSLLDGVQGVIAIPRNPGTIMAANTYGEYAAPNETAERIVGSTGVEITDKGAAFAAETKVQQEQVVAQLRHRYRDYDIRGVAGHWAGMLDGTPDSHPFVGPYPDVNGLWVGCGLTGYGVQRGPGVGETLAKMAQAKPLDVDVSAYALDRFDPDMDFQIDMSGDNPFLGFRGGK